MCDPCLNELDSSCVKYLGKSSEFVKNGDNMTKVVESLISKIEELENRLEDCCKC